jgi:hypothetical protein
MIREKRLRRWIPIHLARSLSLSLSSQFYQLTIPHLSKLHPLLTTWTSKCNRTPSRTTGRYLRRVDYQQTSGLASLERLPNNSSARRDKKEKKKKKKDLIVIPTIAITCIQHSSLNFLTCLT